MFSPSIIFLFTVLIVNANGQCTWRGTAPFCNGKCQTGEYDAKSSPTGGENWNGYGKSCATGSKKYCCRLNSCSFHGTAPFCNPQNCADGQVQIASSSNGDGKSCLSGSKKLCCPLNHTRKVKVSLYSDPSFGGSNETYDEYSDCINVMNQGTASSLNTYGTCVRVYSQNLCTGKTVALLPGSPSHNDLAKLNMNDQVRSVGPCLQNDDQRSELVKRGYDIRFFDTAVYIGILAALAQDRNRLTGPVNFYQTGWNGRTETMVATIRRSHIGTGTATNDNTRSYARRMGNNNDDAGHLLGAQLGGSGTDQRNIFPQNANFNRGAFAQFEGWVRDIVQLHGEAVYTVNLIYDGNTTRPIRILTRIEYTDIYTGIPAIPLNGDFLNP